MPPTNESRVKQSDLNLVLVITAITIILMAALGVAYYVINDGVLPNDTHAPVRSHATPVTSLGADLYQKAQDPVSDKLPDTPSASANPINDAYKNPF